MSCSFRRSSARRRSKGVFHRDVDDECRVRRFVAATIDAISRSFRREQQDVARCELVEPLEAGRLNAKYRHRGMSSLIGGHDVVRHCGRSRSDQFGFCRRVRAVGGRRNPRPTVGRGKQLLAIDDRHHPVIAYTPRRVNAVADDVVRAGAASQLIRRSRMLERGDRAVQRVGCRTGCARLPAGQTKGADVGRSRRVLQVVNQHRLRLEPERRGVLAARQVRDAARALPPRLVGRTEAGDRRNSNR